MLRPIYCLGRIAYSYLVVNAKIGYDGLKEDDDYYSRLRAAQLPSLAYLAVSNNSMQC